MQTLLIPIGALEFAIVALALAVGGIFYVIMALSESYLQKHQLLETDQDREARMREQRYFAWVQEGEQRRHPKPAQAKLAPAKRRGLRMPWAP